MDLTVSYRACVHRYFGCEMSDRGRLSKAFHAIDEQMVFLVASFEKNIHGKNVLIMWIDSFRTEIYSVIAEAHQWITKDVVKAICLKHYDFITHLKWLHISESLRKCIGHFSDCIFISFLGSFFHDLLEHIETPLILIWAIEFVVFRFVNWPKLFGCMIWNAIKFPACTFTSVRFATWNAWSTVICFDPFTARWTGNFNQKCRFA